MKTILAISIAAAMLAIPAGSAAWNYAGSSEPDNSEDSQTWMWANAPLAAKKRVYFNGFTVTAGGLVSIGANVNVAAIQTHFQPNGVESYSAILGNWVDCNGDGYVGLGEAGLREYDAALLIDSSICPPATGDINQWDGVSHNYNGWVSELVPIGTDGGQPSAAAGNEPDVEDNEFDTRILRDNEARVWGDYGRPTDVGGAIATCPIRPFPRGTVQSTGGLLDYTDCHSGRLGAMPQPVPGGLLETWNFAVDTAGASDLRFADDDNGHSGPAGEIGTFGSEDSSNAAVIVTDCSQPELFNSTVFVSDTNDAAGNPVSEDDEAFLADNFELALHPLGPAVGDTSSPTIPGQVNQTFEETGNCDFEDDDGKDVYGLVESDFEGDVPTDKRQARFNMEFEDNGILNTSARGALVGDGLFGSGTQVPYPTHEGAAGASANNMRVVHDWFARVALVKGALPTTRQALGPNVDPFAPAEYVTYYAYVGSTTTTKGFVLPGGGVTAKYGAAQCGAFTSGVHNGWNCDASLWNRNNDGTPMPETQGGLAKPGTLYNLRDVDCEDGSTGLGIPLGFGALGVAPCRGFN